jgi:hypothetical protein
VALIFDGSNWIRTNGSVKSNGQPIAAVNYNTLADIPSDFIGIALVNGVFISINSGYINVNSFFRLKLAGTGAVTVDIIDYLGVVTLNAFTYSLPSDVGIKKFDSETIISIKITYSSTATVTYLG